MDWKEENCIGLRLRWNYADAYVDISLPAYVDNILKRLCYPPPTNLQYSPYEYFPITFGERCTRQYVTATDSSPPLRSSIYIQQVEGSLLYYARALDNTILPALNDIYTQQRKLTENTLKKSKILLDYVSTYKNTFLRYYASNMVISVDSDTAYLVSPCAKSWITVFFYFKHAPDGTILPKINNPIHIECR